MNKKELLIFEALANLKSRIEDIEMKFNIKENKDLEQDVWMPVLRLSLGIEDKKDEGEKECQ